MHFKFDADNVIQKQGDMCFLTFESVSDSSIKFKEVYAVKSAWIKPEKYNVLKNYFNTVKN